jgi:uncharacterized protein
MARLWISLCLLLAALAGGPALAQPQFPERGTAPVVDAANIIDPAAEAELSAKLDAFEQRNQRQFVVATIPSLDGYDIADYGYQLGRHWGLGDTENDDGIILLVAPNDRKVRIETGYGIESIIPDGLAYDIIEGEILPRFKSGEMTGGIVAGADAIIRQLELPPEEAQAIAAQASAPQGERGGFPIGALLWIGIVLFFVILPMLGRVRGRHYRRGGVAGAVGDVLLWTAINAAMNSGRGSGGGSWGGGGSSWGGGGGFSGGGGSFGGGGASGSW